MDVFNRVELKYLINSDICNKFENDLKDYVILDSYNKTDKGYDVCNIYYDTKDDQFIKKSLMNKDYTFKLRLRTYDLSKKDDLVFIELKKKKMGTIHKVRSMIKLSEVGNFIKTGNLETKDYMNVSAISEISNLINSYKIVPKTYISYNRKAFHSKNNNNLRLTFDTNILARRENILLDYDIKKKCNKILENDKVLFELKTNEDIPIWIIKLLLKYRIHSTGFSKYGTEYRNFVKNS